MSDPKKDQAKTSTTSTGKKADQDKSQQKAQQDKFESSSEGDKKNAAGDAQPTGGRSSDRARPGQDTDIDGKVGVGRSAQGTGRGSSQDQDDVGGTNPTDISMVEPTGEATGDEGEETGRSGRTSTNRAF